MRTRNAAISPRVTLLFGQNLPPPQPDAMPSETSHSISAAKAEPAVSLNVAAEAGAAVVPSSAENAPAIARTRLRIRCRTRGIVGWEGPAAHGRTTETERGA